MNADSSDVVIAKTEHPSVQESWSRYMLDWDDDGVPHIVDIDAAIDWNGWSLPEFVTVDGGAL